TAYETWLYWSTPETKEKEDPANVFRRRRRLSYWPER
ncbi:hypothetical protein GWI33_001190, partial [Rhynchophorus ferrugineus]